MSIELDRCRSIYQRACLMRRGQGAAFVRMQDRLHDELRHEICMAKARDELLVLNQTRMTLKALRDTLNFGETR